MNICHECAKGDHGHVSPGGCLIYARVEIRTAAGPLQKGVRCECGELPDGDARQRSPLADTQIEVTR